MIITVIKNSNIPASFGGLSIIPTVTKPKEIKKICIKAAILKDSKRKFLIISSSIFSFEKEIAYIPNKKDKRPNTATKIFTGVVSSNPIDVNIFDIHPICIAIQRKKPIGVINSPIFLKRCGISFSIKLYLNVTNVKLA